MKRKVIALWMNTILISLCLLTNIGCFAQTTFNDKHLKILNEIAISPTQNQALSLMKAEKYILDDKGENPNGGGENFVFSGSYDQEIMLSYAKNKELVSIGRDLLTADLVLCKIELKAKGFTILSTTEEKENGITVTITKWGKTGYPYRFVLYQSEDKVSQLTLQSKLSGGY